MSTSSSTSTSSALFQRLKTLDLYRDIPKDLTQQTTTGAVISVVASLLVLYLFVSELASFLSPSVTHSMFVDHPFLPHLYTSSVTSLDSAADSYDLLTVNLNISLPAIPCSAASLDMQDVVGSHVEDVGGSVHKTTIEGGQDGAEGCNLSGRLTVKKVPGNIHISAHSGHGGVVDPMNPMGGGRGGEVNVSHVIHRLYFGDDDSLLRIPSAVTSPLSGSRRIARPINAVNPYGQSITTLPSYESAQPPTPAPPLSTATHSSLSAHPLPCVGIT